MTRLQRHLELNKKIDFSRWRVLVRTTLSGKTQFVCLICGRVSIAPDKECPPFENWTPSGPVEVRCSEMEDMPNEAKGESTTPS